MVPLARSSPPRLSKMGKSSPKSKRELKSVVECSTTSTTIIAVRMASQRTKVVDEESFKG